MGQRNRKGQRSGKEASKHAREQRRRREEERRRRRAKRQTKKTHHDGLIGKDHKRGR